jgi:shikimate kinase
MKTKKSIILVGMPGAGKSTIGIILAKDTGLNFIDTDVAIQVHTGETLQQTLDKQGYLRLREIEEEVLLKTSCHNCVVATGGSAVYSEAGMKHLKQHGLVVFLDVPLATLRSRIHNYETRGIARRPGQSFQTLFDERCLLYKKYADLTISCDECSAQDISDLILTRLKQLQA